MTSQDIQISITSLDDSLMQYILRFLCGSLVDEKDGSAEDSSLRVAAFRDPIEEYVTTLLRVERISKYFQRIIQDDKLWGYWSVLHGMNSEQHVYLSVPDYGRGIRDYDERFQNWRELTMCKAVLARIRHVQNEDYPDEKIFGYDTESSISYWLAQAIFQHFWSTELRIYLLNARLQLRKDSAAMLFTLVGEYVCNLLHWSNMMAISTTQKYFKGRHYPELDIFELKLMKHAKENDISHEHITVEELNMTSDYNYQFDKLIRTIAYRAGIVKITNDAIHYAKNIYLNRMYMLLRYACLYIYHNLSIKNSQKPIITNVMDAYHIAPKCHVKEVDSAHYLTFMPVPGQFESANVLYQSKSFTHKVYGIHNITMNLENLEECYSFEDNDQESDSFQDKVESDSMLESMMSRISISIPTITGVPDEYVNQNPDENEFDDSTADDDEGYEDIDSGDSDDEWLPTIQ